MRYAALADAEPVASPTGNPGGAFGLGSLDCRPEHYVSAGAARPQVQIFTLGRFGLSIFERAIEVNGKAKHRPLELLQALVALGGRDVACSRLCEFLWPDSDGDLGGRNLNITVHRLRLLLRGRGAVIQHSGKLTLNAQLCRVDIWDFERLANSGLEGLGDSGTVRRAQSDLRAALALYTGHFLARESEEAWMLAPRMRLKTKFERLIGALGGHFEQQRRFSDAIDICRQALELDPLNEIFYRRMMSCYLKQGEFASVLSTYRRCREALAKGLSAPVSGETEKLHGEALCAIERGAGQSNRVAPIAPPHRLGVQPEFD